MVVLSKMIDIFQMIVVVDFEFNVYCRFDKIGLFLVFKDWKCVLFNWEGEVNVNVKKFIDKGNDEEFSWEVIYCVNGKFEDVMEYCRVFDFVNSSKGWVFKWNFILEVDVYKELFLFLKLE